MKLFFALAAIFNYVIYDADAVNEHAQADGPEDPFYVRIRSIGFCRGDSSSLLILPSPRPSSLSLGLLWIRLCSLWALYDRALILGVWDLDRLP